MREIIRELRWHLIAAEVAIALVMLLVVVDLATSIARNVAVALCVTNAESDGEVPASCGVALTLLTIERQEIVGKAQPEGGDGS
jgi:hypothetical protein